MRARSVLAAVVAALTGVVLAATPARASDRLDAFGPMPTILPPYYSVTTPTGHVINYSVYGPRDGQPLLLLSGNPSNWSSIGLVAPYAELIKRWNIRVIQPERVGNGVTPFPPCAPPYDTCISPADDAADWSYLMHRLGYQTYSVAGLSSGGAYADWVMKTHWREIRSVHLSSALDTSGTRDDCLYLYATTPDAFRDAYQPLLDDPSQIWAFFPARDFATISSIPGAVDWLNLSTHASPDAIGASYDSWTECHYPIDDLSQVRTPTFIYHGGIDQTVPLSMAQHHAAQYPNVRRFRVYPNDAHLSSVRHLGQLLLDVHEPTGRVHLICDLSQGQTRVVDERTAAAMISAGTATEDICAWVGTPGQ